MKGEDRYLQKIGNRFHYVRKVPTKLQSLDTRTPAVRISLGTKSIHTARVLRDARECADDELWDALKAGVDAESARERYDAALRLNSALGFRRMSEVDLLADANRLSRYGPDGEITDMPEIMRRPAQAVVRGVDVAASEFFQAALAGAVPRPAITVREALEEHLEDLTANDWMGKSDGQRASSTKPKRRAVENFAKVVANLPIEEIDRDDTVKFYRFWRSRMASGEVGYSTANRDLDNMRVLIRWYFERSGEPERRNPFDGLSFKKPRHIKRRVGFTPEYVSKNFLHGDKLASMKPDIRRALLVILGTGCRPSEVLNLSPVAIRLDEEVPHINIMDRAGRELKTEQSNRDVPLVGVALTAMRAHLKDGNNDGFPRYRDKETNFSNAMKATFDRKALRETPEHSVYSLRHMFEDLLKDAEIGDEMRRELMGHRIDRSQYGRGFTLEAKRDALERAFEPLKFDPAIV